ncbi:MAG: nitrile hydratase accessory protein [Burkholderiaceae bacterium]|nr:nitrile hydratase accessory protein [Burkholderiaceae bacterium]
MNDIRSTADTGQVGSVADAIAACGLPESTGAAFAEPWQAQLFAMTIALHEAGRFAWSEWVGYLSQSIRDAQAGGDPDLGDTYWRHWLDAFERLLRDKGLAGPLELAARRESIRAYSRVARSASIMRAG